VLLKDTAGEAPEFDAVEDGMFTGKGASFGDAGATARDTPVAMQMESQKKERFF
jgi:hypothetical protein